MSKEFYTKLAEIQRQLNAPKGQYNSFGKYHYRSCEDILEGVKPLLNGLFLSISDEVILIGDRHYVKATAKITDGETWHEATALAREEETKKGMDSAQITGSTSSYARKYCLNGLFGIDDAKDADTDEHKHQQNNTPKEQKKQRNPAEILADFTKYAMECTDLDSLKSAYRAACNAMNGNAEYMKKAKDVLLTRGNELKGDSNGQ